MLPTFRSHHGRLRKPVPGDWGQSSLIRRVSPKSSGFSDNDLVAIELKADALVRVSQGWAAGSRTAIGSLVSLAIMIKHKQATMRC
jgi:hypothetical protein